MTNDKPGNSLAGALREYLASSTGAVKNVGGQLASAVYNGALAFLLLVLLARELGPASLGVFIYIQTVASLFAILQDGGYQIMVFREESSPSGPAGLPVDRLLSDYSGHLSLVTLFGAAVVLVSPTPYRTGFLCALAYYVMRSLTNMVSAMLKGRGAFGREALWRAGVGTAMAVPVVALIAGTRATPETVFLGFAAGCVPVLATRPGRRLLARLKWRLPSDAPWKSIFAFIVISAATMVYFKCDIIMLRHLQPDLGLVGEYGAAYKPLEGLVYLAAPVAQVAFRSLRLVHLEPGLFAARLKRMLGAAAGIALAVIAGGSALAGPLMSLAFGPAYLPAARFLPVLLLALFFILPNAVLTQSLIALNDEKFYAIAALLCAAANIGLNFALIPRFAAFGAAWATVATEAVLTLLLVFRLLRRPSKGEKNEG